MLNKVILFVLLPLFLAGCAMTGEEQVTNFEQDEFEPISRNETVSQDQQEETDGSSLWRQGHQGMYSNVKAREAGDVVTVAIQESATANNVADTTTSRDSSASASLGSLLGLEENLSDVSEDIDPNSLLDAEYSSSFDGSGGTSREGELQATLTARVVEVMPGGNLRIQGSKRITINNENNLIRLAGVVRPEDVNSRNVVQSRHVMNANIDYQGRGVISDKQGQGWLVRIMDNVWPF